MANLDREIDVLSFYKADLRRIEALSDTQEKWLGIVINSGRIKANYFESKDQNSREDCDFFYIWSLNKIRQIVEDLSLSNISNSATLLNCFTLIIEDIHLFKRTTKPPKKNVINEFLTKYPDKYSDLIYDLVSFSLLLPLSILDTYLNDISQTRKLPAIGVLIIYLERIDSVFELKRIDNFISISKNLLVESFLEYTRYLAYKYRSRGLDYEDIIQEASIGLMKAVERFDVKQNSKFKTYGVWWIKQSILRAIANSSRTIRVPVHLHEKINKLNQIRSTFIIGNYQEPSIKELSQLSGLTKKQTESLVAFILPELSFETLETCELNLMQNYLYTVHDVNVNLCKHCPFLDENYSDDANSSMESSCVQPCDQSIVWYINNSKFIRVYRILDSITQIQTDQIDKIKQKETINEVLQGLHPREAQVLRLRHGFDTDEPMTLDKIGTALGITRERVRQIEAHSISKMKHPSIRRKLRPEV